MLNAVRLQRVVRCPPERLFRSLVDPHPMAESLPPQGFVAQVHSIDPRVGGSHRVSFTNLNPGTSHSFGATYTKIVPNKRTRYTHRLHDPNLPGEMHATISLRKLTTGADLTIVPEGIPEQLPPVLCCLGWKESLSMLLAPVEPGDHRGSILSSHGVPPMMSPPQKQHEWLKSLVGDWQFSTSCEAGPGQPPLKATGTERVRALGDLWIVCEGRSTMPDGTPMESVMTLGFDPVKQRFVGTWIGSPMAHMFIYEGQLDATGNILPLNTTGPSFTDPAKTSHYQDIIERKSDTFRSLTSKLRLDDGSWQHFMSAEYRRAGR
jgi:uncharacterized protein YndB with AHSA1/START domain